MTYQMLPCIPTNPLELHLVIITKISHGPGYGKAYGIVYGFGTGRSHSMAHGCGNACSCAMARSLTMVRSLAIAMAHSYSSLHFQHCGMATAKRRASTALFTAADAG